MKPPKIVYHETTQDFLAGVKKEMRISGQNNVRFGLDGEDYVATSQAYQHRVRAIQLVSYFKTTVEMQKNLERLYV